MIDDGYTLSGKILDDPRLQKACLWVMLIIMGNPFQEAITILQMSEDAVETNYTIPSTHAKKYYYHTVLAVAGKYNIRDSKSNAPF
jgi:hypothetical protein